MFGFFKRYDVHLSPEVRGQITLDGQPLANIEIERILDYDKEYFDTTLSDENGKFYFPEKSIKSTRPGQMLDETRTRQVIGLTHHEKRYLLWYTTTSSLAPEKVIVDKLTNLSCDLSNPEERYEIPIHEDPSFYHVIISICRW